jgi:hypothetical protein
MGNLMEATDKEVLLVEYQTAQESAQHHDNLVWTHLSLQGKSYLKLDKQVFKKSFIQQF